MTHTDGLTKKVVLFGAGSAGKGLIGLLFNQAGYQVVFVDIDPVVVQKLHTAKQYKVCIHGRDGNQTLKSVSGYTILPAQDRERIAKEIVTADLVLTAVFVQNLPDVAQTIALAIRFCQQAQRSRPLDCIACENMKNSSSILAQHVHAGLDEEDLRYCTEFMGFPDCMINRVVPKSPDLLYVETEDYCEWTVDIQAWKSHKPTALAFIEGVDNQDARLDRKLMVYNGMHAASAYYGHIAGHTWLHETIRDSRLTDRIQKTLDQIADAVQRHHRFEHQDMANYKQDFWARCRNPGLKDPIVRVARQPQRKLGHHERLVGPAKLAQQYGLPRNYILEAIWAALHYRHADDADSLALADSLETKGLRQTLVSASGLEQDDPLIDELEKIPTLDI